MPNFEWLNVYTLHITLYDVFFFAMIIVGITFALLLAFVKTVNRTANRFLALALVTMVLWMVRVLAIDIMPGAYLPYRNRLPMQFLLALGPLMYFYVLKITRTKYRFRWKDLLHFSPLLLEQVILHYPQFNPVLQLITFISILTYLYQCNKLIQDFYHSLQPVLMDRSLVEFKWLRRLLSATALLWIFWFVYAAVDYARYGNQAGLHVYYPFYIFFAMIMIWTAAAAFLKPQAAAMAQTAAPVRAPVPAELRAKGTLVKRAMAANLYYQDPEISLNSLAEKLGMHPHELSKVINTVFKKNFNDFVNEYRVRDAVTKMQEPAYDNITLLGIAYEAGFNSKATFIRAFKQVTGKNPAEYKQELEKQVSTYHLQPRTGPAAVISSHQTTHTWAGIKLNRKYMFKNYFKTAWRSLVRNKIYSLVNVLGLSLGVCACLVIFLITRYEFSFDTFHPDGDRIFCVDFTAGGNHLNLAPTPMAAAMRREMSGLETVAAFIIYNASATVPGSPGEKQKAFDDAGSMALAEPGYFNVFPHKWIAGNAATALNMPHTVVLTAEKAKEYFGDVEPGKVIGRTIYYQDSLMATVTGVVADWAGNSDFSFSQWVSYATIPTSFLKSKSAVDDWGSFATQSQAIIKLAKGVKPSQIDAQFTGFAKRHYGPNAAFSFRLKPLSGIHFHTEYGGRGRKASLPVLYTLMAAAGFILALAIINFINLSTAQSMQRAREIGVRKVLGGSKAGISVQFFTETLLLTVAAVVVAVILVRPVFSLAADIIPEGVGFRFDGATLLFLLLVITVTTLLAGFYPARVLGSYRPTVTLKGANAVSGGEKGTLRKALIVFQFTISLLFIIASLIIGSQLRYVLQADLGFKTDAVITLGFPRGYPPQSRINKTVVLMDKLRQRPGVVQVIREGRPPMGGDMTHSGFSGGALKGKEENPIDISIHSGDADYLPFYGMKLLAGRNILPGDSARELLISEACAHALGFADVSKALGREVVVGPGESYPVAGVVANFYENSFREATWPVVIKNDPSWEKLVAVKIAAKSMTAGDIKTLIGNIEKDWKSVFPSAPFTYSFLDESIAKLYADDLRTGWLANAAMGITVFISCLGLLGLAIFSTQKRTREIGIRKVLGATVAGIIAMLCKDIVRLILVALLIASPVAWYLMHNWLQGFAYRTTLSGWVFVAAGAAAIAIALLTVGFQAIRAARANPVKSLRTE
ncbi:MAG TPA: ABC transporter permease [Chitinophagaceae bacterium]|nr:ABC transporter permease [Chitinophagaceae bacterium]